MLSSCTIPLVRNNSHYTIFYDEEESFLEDNQLKHGVASERSGTMFSQENKKHKRDTKFFHLIKNKNLIKMQDNGFLFSKGKFSRALECLQNKVHNLSQQFHGSTKKEIPTSCVTPTRRTRHILGRTPIKLYSPFAIETPTDKPAWYHTDIHYDENTPVKFSKLEHLEKKKKRKYKGVRHLFYKLTGKRNYYKL